MMRKQNDVRRYRWPKPNVLVALIVGMMLLWIMLIVRYLKGAPSLSMIPASHDGWHTINVFYGEKSGLKEDMNQEFYAQVHQDQVLLDLIGDNGYFVDLAANDAKIFSNTLVLERHGWNGLCIEPNPIYWYGLSHRKCTVVGSFVGATKEKVQVKFRGVLGGIVGNKDIKMVNPEIDPEAEVEERYTASLSEVFAEFNVPRSIDYLSLDVEGAEFLVMKNFLFNTYHIKVMTVERPNKDLRNLLEGKGFIFLKDLSWWGETLWAHKSMGLTPTHPKISKIKTLGKQ